MRVFVGSMWAVTSATIGSMGSALALRRRWASPSRSLCAQNAVTPGTPKSCIVSASSRTMSLSKLQRRMRLQRYTDALALTQKVPAWFECGGGTTRCAWRSLWRFSVPPYTLWDSTRVRWNPLSDTFHCICHGTIPHSIVWDTGKQTPWRLVRKRTFFSSCSHLLP
jgi:hypothetical protein